MDARSPPSALVLAAGEGRRMGGSKALLLVDGVSLVQRHLLRLHEAGCRSMAVVVRPAVAPIVAELVGTLPCSAGVRVVPASTDSQADSLAAGLRALLALEALEHDATVLVTPVDMLPPALGTVGALLAALQGDVLAATPLYRGRGGHPVAVRAELLAPYLSDSLRELPSLRDVLTRAAHRRVRVEVDDERIHGDLDTPSDVRAVGGASPVFLAAR
jgi:CTP:molybdopterin cytidylyltransferase MocA